MIKKSYHSDKVRQDLDQIEKDLDQVGVALDQVGVDLHQIGRIASIKSLPQFLPIFANFDIVSI